MILSKLSSIITYGKKIAFSRPISVYDIKNDQSYILDGFEDVPEASVMMTRDFWLNAEDALAYGIIDTIVKRNK